MKKLHLSILAFLLVMAGLPLITNDASAETTFRITRKIYGQGRYEGDDAESNTDNAEQAPVLKTEPEPEQAEQPVAPAPEAEPEPQQAEHQPEPAPELKPEVKTVKQQPQQEAPAKEEEPVRVAEPLPPVAEPNLKQPEIKKPVDIRQAEKQEPEPDFEIEEITPKTEPVDEATQPPHTPTLAEKAENLAPAKNEELFQEALKHYNDATKLGQQGKFKEAVVAYQKALYIHPAFPDARVGLAVSYASLGQWLPMINELEMALQLQDMFLDKFNLVQAHYNLGAAYCVQGDTKRAMSEFDEVKEARHPNIKQLEMFIQSHCNP